MKSKGLLVVISSPSGGGKDSVIKALIKRIPNSARCITTTSRPPRPGNKEGVDYHFVSETDFKEKIAHGEFVEYNVYAGNYYGTERGVLDQALLTHPVVYTQVEINGKLSFDRLHISHLAIFLMPENLDVLRERIVARGGLTLEEVEERLQIARQQIAQAGIYDLQIINQQGKFDETVEKVEKAIHEAEATQES